MENNSLLLCETASVSELTSRAVRAVVNGDIDPITAHINISRMEAAIKAFKDNEEIRDITLRELSQYGKSHQFGIAGWKKPRSVSNTIMRIAVTVSYMICTQLLNP